MIQEPHSYWATTIKSIYFPNKDFWAASEGRYSSWVWKSLIHGRNFLRKEGRWSIGMNSSVSIIEDLWLSSGSRASVTPNASAVVVKEVTDSSNQWDFSKLRINFSPSRAIAAIQTPISWNSVDKLYWPHNPSGIYTVKTGYHLLHQTPNTNLNLPSSSTSTPVSLWTSIWNSLVPNKIKHFILKVCHNILPIKASLFKKKITQNPFCPICNSEPETIEHVFLLCPWTRPLWFGLQFLPTPSSSGLSYIGIENS